jgi:hypothetical protein
VVDRRFWVADGRRAEFEEVFEVGGAWATLLTQADGYQQTEVWCESMQPAQYRVRDFWNWHRNFESFRGRFQAEYERFEDRLRQEGVVVEEQFLGAYYEDRPGDEDELVAG